MAFRQKQSGSETRERAPIIGFRATDAERAQIEAAAQRAGLTVGSYVRSRALAKPVTRAQRPRQWRTQQLAHLLGMLGVLSGMLQAVVKQHGRGDMVTDDELRQAMAGFREAVAAISGDDGQAPYPVERRA